MGVGSGGGSSVGVGSGVGSSVGIGVGSGVGSDVIVGSGVGVDVGSVIISHGINVDVEGQARGGQNSYANGLGAIPPNIYIDTSRKINTRIIISHIPSFDTDVNHQHQIDH